MDILLACLHRTVVSSLKDDEGMEDSSALLFTRVSK